MRVPNNQDIGSGRPTCYACFRPQSHCICDLVEPFLAHVNVLLIQHPNERFKYYSTAKIVQRAISNCRVIRGVEFTEPELTAAINPADSFLLFPGSHALDCESAPLDQTRTVIIIDGTWDEARKIIHRNPLLKTIPQLTFKRPLRSEYQIRKQPQEHCLSTIESVAHLLKLNGQTCATTAQLKSYDSLLSAFRAMVQRQLAYFPRMQGIAAPVRPFVRLY